MNKIIPIYLILLSTTTFAQVKFAPELGFNAALQTRKTGTDVPGVLSSQDSRLAPGFSGGLMLDIKVLKQLYIQAGAVYFFNNIKYSHKVDFTAYGLGQPSAEQYDRTDQLRSPLYLMFKSGLEGTGRFIAGIGPYAAWSFSGNRVMHVPLSSYDGVTHAYSYNMYTSSTDIRFGNDAAKSDLRRWDVGVNACIGYESNVGIYFRGTFNYGLLNQNPMSSDDFRMRNWGFGVSIGYLIGKDGW